ncbi:MAG: hypothetical protein ACXADY_09925 [Candidatus Hodarchaeales archaeon]|jgi:hypothetical protein
MSGLEELNREKLPKDETPMIKICILGSTERMKKILMSYDNLHGFTTSSMFLMEGVLSSSIFRKYQIEGKEYELYILPNLEKHFKKVVEQPTSHFYLGAKGVIIFFDLDDRDSFEDVNKWHEKLSQEKLASIPKSLIGLRGNKDSVVSTEEITNITTVNAIYYQIVRPQISSIKNWVSKGIAMKFEEILKDFLKQLIISNYHNETG